MQVIYMQQFLPVNDVEKSLQVLHLGQNGNNFIVRGSFFNK